MGSAEKSTSKIWWASKRSDTSVIESQQEMIELTEYILELIIAENVPKLLKGSK